MRLRPQFLAGLFAVGALATIYAASAAIANQPTLDSADLSQFTPQEPCHQLVDDDVPFTVCRFDIERDTPRLFLRGKEGKIIATFDRLAQSVAQGGDSLIFAMNAGMYDRKRRPIGLYVEDGRLEKSANTKDGYGNFHLMPNGIFYIEAKDETSVSAGVMETSTFLDAGIEPIHATQSGPMLVIDGAFHPRFIPNSSSQKRRNGVGVSADGKTVWFAISEAPVNFYGFARLFRDRLQTPNALFLDGEVSKLFAPSLNRNDKGLPMGPMIGVIRRGDELP